VRLTSLLSVLLLAPAVAAAQQEPPLLLRFSVSPQGPVWIGQRVTVTLTAMTPVRFAAPPRFPDPAPRGRAVVLPEASTIPGTERVGGASFAALQHSTEIFPSEAGDLLLPGPTLHASVAGVDGRVAAAMATAPEIRIPVRPAPPGLADLTRLAVAPHLRLTAETDRPPERLRVGEAITRTVRIEAEDTAAMLLPPALWGRPEGVAVYPDSPRLEDQTDRGMLRAVRVERAAYVPQRPGPVELPGFSLLWLDPSNGRARELRVEPIRFEALPAAQLEVLPPRRWWPWVTAGVAFVLVAGTAFVAWRHRVFQRVADPERDAFRALTAACRSADAPAAMAALLHWSDAILPRNEARSIASVAALARNPGLAAEGQALERHIYGRQATAAWNPSNLMTAARDARRTLRRRGRHRSHAAALPDLNPPEGRPPGAPRAVLRHWAR
jgi:hypothetical protein